MTSPLLSLLLLTLLAGLFMALRWRTASPPLVRRGRTPTPTARTLHRYRPPKPCWVRAEVLRHKALMPANGCRKIAATFNHLHGRRRAMTVSKSYVANMLRNSQAEVLRLRAELKHRRPRPIPKNLTWAMDLTYCEGDACAPILGVIDHGTRACLALRRLRSKGSTVILRHLLDLVERYGTPKWLRTDNEPVFTSRLFRFSVALLGIRHQRSAPFAPWQNGRMERFFGTFKSSLRLWTAKCKRSDPDQNALNEFRAWYNHLRPHQHLGDWAPAWAWAKKAPDLRRKPKLCSAWDGILTGYYWRQ